MAKTLIALLHLNVLAMSYCYIPGLEGWSAHDQSLLADVRVLKHALHPIEYITRPSEQQPYVEAPQLFEAHQQHRPVEEYSEELVQGHHHDLHHETFEYKQILDKQASSEHDHHHQQEYKQIVDQHEEHDHHDKKNAHYKFEYAVNDPKTGDVKSQREERHGDVVRGQYSVLEEDGNVRTVKYYADWKTGFHAQVHNSKPR